MATLLPLLRIKKIVESLLEFVKTDYETKIADNKEEQTILYQVLYGNKEDNWDFYEQAKNIFLKPETDPQKLNVTLHFSKNFNSLPNIWVREPAKQRGGYNSIGSYIPEDKLFDDGTYSEQLRDTKRASYELVCSSPNPLLTILIAEVVYSLLVGAQDTLNELFGTFEFSMKELMANNDSIPMGLTIRAISVETQFENIVPKIQLPTSLVNKVIFNYPTINEK